ncbi:hypothetical protein [Floccifex sp.]|uniref:hypothetical protein n=1 Tax=Floccifex sp. TaxID=2815810 RepID=UPI003EFAAB1D
MTKDKDRVTQLINDFKSCKYCCKRIIELNLRLEEMNHKILGISHGSHKLSSDQEKSMLPMPTYNRYYTSPLAMLYEIEMIEDEVNYYQRRIMECKPIELLDMKDQNILFDLYIFRFDPYEIAEKYGYSKRGLYKHIRDELSKII